MKAATTVLLVIFCVVLVGCCSGQNIDALNQAASEASASAGSAHGEIKHAIERMEELESLIAAKKCKLLTATCEEEVNEVFGALLEAESILKQLESEITEIPSAASNSDWDEPRDW